MSKINLNQLKKSVFNMKNYINYNANNPYAVKTLLDETIAIDANCNITNNGNAISIYKNESEDGYSCYFCWNKTNTPIDVNEEFVSMKIYINDKLIYNQVPKHITSGIALSTNSIIDKYLDKDTNVIKFVSLSMYHNKKVYYDENGKYHSDDEENTQSYKAIVSIKKGQQNPGTVRIVGEFLTENKNYPGINCFKSDKYGSLTYASNIDDTGVGSINFSNDPSPDYTIIIPCSSMNNSFKNTCSSGFILGSANKLNGINYYSILGFNNTIERKVNASYNESFVNIIGQYNTYKADASTVNYKPVSIIGNYINACNSGLYVGMGGTFEKDDIMGIADGTAKKEKIIFRVKRDGRVKASAPTENDDLTNKKYVDDKVAGIVNSAPETLDTLQELATALGNDANFATTISTQIGKKVDKVDGMSLTHNDLTNELKTNYDAAYNYSQAKHSYNDLTDLPTIPSIAGLATEEYVNNKLISTTVYLDEDITDTTSTMTYKDEYSAYTFNKLDIASIIDGLELKIKVVNNQSDTVGKTLTFKDFVYDSTLEAYSAYYNENDSTDTGDKVYITNNNDKTIIVYSTEIMFAGLWKHVKLCRDEDKYAKKTDIHTHANKDVLDTITAEKVAQWDKNAGGSTSGINIVTISQSDYDALATKDPNTLYLITTTNSGTIDTSTNNITLSDDLPAGAYTLKYEDENNQPLEGFDEITTLEVQ